MEGNPEVTLRLRAARSAAVWALNPRRKLSSRARLLMLRAAFVLAYRAIGAAL